MKKIIKGKFIRKEKVNVGISPEGTRRRKPSFEEPLLLPFKKGIIIF